jgi:hypothetical protein
LFCPTISADRTSKEIYAASGNLAGRRAFSRLSARRWPFSATEQQIADLQSQSKLVAEQIPVEEQLLAKGLITLPRQRILLHARAVAADLHGVRSVGEVWRTSAWLQPDFLRLRVQQDGGAEPRRIRSAAKAAA